MNFPLKPLTSEPETHRIVAWDTETKNMVAFLIGVRWGERQDQSCQFEGERCVPEFIEWLLIDSEENPGTYYFAHNGGGFDHQFLLYEMLEKQNGRFKVKPVISGGSTIIVIVEEIKTERSFMLVDSLRILNMSLKKIGQALGEAQKQEFDVVNTPADDPRWKEYLDLDTLVLFQALTKVQGAIQDLGGEMKLTAASTAMDLFRRRYLKELRNPIYPEADYHNVYRDCYYGGRVEIFDTRRRTDVKLFDINSLYPTACTYALPTKLQDRNAEGDVEKYLFCDYFSFFVECKVMIPDSVVVPPLPVRRNGKLIFPVGRFWGHWNSWDLRNLKLCGGKILEIKHAHKYQCKPFARNMMIDLYNRRLDKNKPAIGLAAKLLMNSFYGKMGQKTERNVMIFNPSPYDLEKDTWTLKDEIHRRYDCEQFRQEPHIMPQVAAQVTAIARSIHYPYLLNSKDLVYCDTDCVVQSGDLKTGTELGAMKLEDEYNWFKAYLPKMYQGINKEGKSIVKAKGFGGWNKEEYEGGIVTHLSKGGSVNVKGPTKFISLMNSGSLKPREKSTAKMVRACYDKRVVHEDGTTSPIKIWEE